MVDLGTLGGETDVECGVLLAVERERRAEVEGEEDSDPEATWGPGSGEDFELPALC